MEMKGGAASTGRESAERLAIEALGFIAGETDSLARFLAASGIGPATLRRAAAEPAFLAGVLDFLLGDELLLIAFAAHANVPPERVGQARRALAAGGEDRGSDPEWIPKRRGGREVRPGLESLRRGGPEVRPGTDDDRAEGA
jgi:hypothetical protein